MVTRREIRDALKCGEGIRGGRRSALLGFEALFNNSRGGVVPMKRWYGNRVMARTIKKGGMFSAWRHGPKGGGVLSACWAGLKGTNGNPNVPCPRGVPKPIGKPDGWPEISTEIPEHGIYGGK